MFSRREVERSKNMDDKIKEEDGNWKKESLVRRC